MPDILNGETKTVEIPTYVRIIDIADFTFSYFMANGSVEEQP